MARTRRQAPDNNQPLVESPVAVSTDASNTSRLELVALTTVPTVTVPAVTVPTIADIPAVTEVKVVVPDTTEVTVIQVNFTMQSTFQNFSKNRQSSENSSIFILFSFKFLIEASFKAVPTEVALTEAPTPPPPKELKVTDQVSLYCYDPVEDTFTPYTQANFILTNDTTISANSVESAANTAGMQVRCKKCKCDIPAYKVLFRGHINATYADHVVDRLEKVWLDEYGAVVESVTENITPANWEAFLVKDPDYRYRDK